MPTYTEQLTKVQEDVLNTIKEAQDASLKSMHAFREIAASYPTTVPTLPAMPKLEGFPTAHEVIEQSFEFARKFWELRKDYTLKVAELIETASKQAADASVRASKSGKHNN
jgi:hypothetical protein